MKKWFSVALTLCLAWPFCSFAATGVELPVYTEQKTGVVVTAEQPEFSIKLKSNPTTGYSWFLREYHSRYLTPVKHVFQAPVNRKLVGAPGFEVWTFRMKPEAFTVPLQTALRFIYARPWEKSGQSTAVVFWISTQEKKK